MKGQDLPMNERVASCLLIARVLVADGIMTDAERAVLHEAMDRFGLDPAERQRVTDLDGMEEAEAVVGRLSEPARRALADQLVEAALADGKLSPHETALVARISSAIGLS
jgi:uncharacterized tellurite resistance protein B-like protein